VIIADNMVRNGAVADPSSEALPSAPSAGTNAMVGRRPSFDADRHIQTVGIKGYDGFTLARVSPRDPLGDSHPVPSRSGSAAASRTDKIEALARHPRPIHTCPVVVPK
jgi:hypothetical protein